MNRQLSTTWVLIAIGFALVATWWVTRDPPARERAAEPTSKLVSAKEERVVLDEVERNAPARSAPATVVDMPDAEGDALSVDGRVLDPFGVPVSGAKITVQDEEPAAGNVLAISGDDGSFRLQTTKLDLNLDAHAPHMRTLRAQIWRSWLPKAGFIVVAPCVDVRGQVVDVLGRAIPKADVRLMTELPTLAHFPTVLDSEGLARSRSIGADLEGRFSLERAICAEGATLHARCEGYLPNSIAVPYDSPTRARIVLEAPRNSTDRFVSGVVLHANGEPATKAEVHLGHAEAKVDARGEFRMRMIGDDAGEAALIAIEPGSQAALVPQFKPFLRDERESITPVRLILGPPPLSIRGRVLDAAGLPVVGCNVDVLDPTDVPIRNAFKSYSVEALTAGLPRAQFTDEHGDFEVFGLLDREYRLEVQDWRKLGYLDSPPVRAGARGIVLTYPADALKHELRGRVVGRDGSPIADAGIRLELERNDMKSEGARTNTSSNGTFQMHDVPVRRASILAYKPAFITKLVPLDGLDLTSPMEIVLERWTSIVVEDPPFADEFRSFAARDADGRGTVLSPSNTGVFLGDDYLHIRGSSSMQLYVNETTVELVLLDEGGTVIDRRPARFAPGSSNVLKW